MNSRVAMGWMTGLVGVAFALWACGSSSKGPSGEGPTGGDSGLGSGAEGGVVADGEGGSGSTDSGSGGAEGGQGGTTYAASCDAYFTGFLARCSLAGYPTSELARLKGRWDTYCPAYLSLPGASVSESAFSQCASELATASCLQSEQPPACQTIGAGTYPSGMDCLTSIQCQSGSCSMVTPVNDGTAPTCGTCDAPLADGKACGQTGQSCVLPDECLPSGVCGPMGDAGPPPTSIPEGGACSDTSDTAQCAAGLECVGTTCVAPTYVAAGKACDYQSKFCLVGDCNGAGVGSAPDGGETFTPGTCPTVIADGEACDGGPNTTCDTFSNCDNGTCVLAPNGSICP